MSNKIRIPDDDQVGTPVHLSSVQLLDLVGEMAADERPWDPAWVVEIMDRFRAQQRRPRLATPAELDLKPIDMQHAPRDGTMLCLLVDYSGDDAAGPLEDTAEAAWTIGFNSLSNTGEDRWQIAGWCWSHDHFTEGPGKPIGWAPFLPDQLSDYGLYRIAVERRRVVEEEGYGPEHDDLYANAGELWRAAKAYLQGVEDLEDGSTGVVRDPTPPTGWPWAAAWWKPKTTTRDLERVGQLVVAELGRRKRALDRFLALVVEACVAGGAERDYAAAEVADAVPDFLEEEGIEVGHPDRDWGVSGATALADELVLRHLEGGQA
jgi:hypothetical protein